jgi:hypothetical protein
MTKQHWAAFVILVASAFFGGWVVADCTETIDVKITPEAAVDLCAQHVQRAIDKLEPCKPPCPDPKINFGSAAAPATLHVLLLGPALQFGDNAGEELVDGLAIGYVHLRPAKRYNFAIDIDVPFESQRRSVTQYFGPRSPELDTATVKFERRVRVWPRMAIVLGKLSAGQPNATSRMQSP